MYTTVQNLGVGKIFFIIWKSHAHQGYIYLIKNTVNPVILWNIITVKITVFHVNIFKNVIYSCDSWIFNIITQSSVSHDTLEIMLICHLKNISCINVDNWYAA